MGFFARTPGTQYSAPSAEQQSTDARFAAARQAAWERLAAADPVRVAVDTFVTVFTAATRTHVVPYAVHGALQELFGIDEVDEPTIRGTIERTGAKYALDPYFVQCLTMWENALLAGRLSRGEHDYVVLLPRGSEALREPNPAAALEAILRTR